MISDEIKSAVTNSTENSERYHGGKVTIRETITTNGLNFDRHFSTFNEFEFTVEEIRWRFSGVRLMFIGNASLYEIAIHSIVSLKEIEKNKFEFIEAYRDTVNRMSVLTFHNNL